MTTDVDSGATMQQRTTRPAAVTRLAVAVLAALLLAGGCTTAISGTPAADPAPAPTEGPGSDPVLWVDRVCGSLLAFTGPALSQPQFSQSADLTSIKQKLSTYLDGIVGGLNQSRDQLKGVGRSPVGGGDEAVSRIDDVLEKLQTDIGTAKKKVDSADPDDPEAFLATITDAETELGKITAPDALADLSASPRLQKAAAKAANCQQLSAQGSTPEQNAPQRSSPGQSTEDPDQPDATTAGPTSTDGPAPGN